MGTRKTLKKILVLLSVALIVVLQAVFVMPADAGTSAGEQLEVRVQYEGEPGGKIRTKAVFSNAELEALGAHNQMFSNITRVGTIMHSATYGVEIDKIIEAAGIDLSSVKSFTFRASDGYTMTFDGSDYLGSTGWYYPELSRRSDTIDTGYDDGLVQMEAGALDGGVLNSSALLALKSQSLKGVKYDPSYDKMTAKKSYRFFTGQTDLSYLRYEDDDGNEAFKPTKESDITAWDSVKYIYGVDVVLKGSPTIGGITLGIDNTNIKVGSSKQISISFEDVFAELDASDVTWTSSDESVATVDGNGVVTMKKKGTVKITASGYGKTASITLNGTETAAEKPEVKPTQPQAKPTQPQAKPTSPQAKPTRPVIHTRPQSQNRNQRPATKRVIVAKEISIGDEIVPEPEETAAVVANDSQALGAVEPYDKKTVAASAVGALAACGCGAVFRIRRFRADLGINAKGKK